MAGLTVARGRANRSASSPLDLYPVGAGGRQWVYLVGFSDGRVKLGITKTPRRRLKQYASSKQAIDWFHLFSPVPADLGAIEPKLLQALAQVGRRMDRSESFLGLDKQLAIATVRDAWAMAREPQHLDGVRGALAEAIRLAGGQTALLAGINDQLKTGHLYYWLREGSVPDRHVLAIERTTGVCRTRLCAHWRELWPEYVADRREAA